MQDQVGIPRDGADQAVVFAGVPVILPQEHADGAEPVVPQGGYDGAHPAPHRGAHGVREKGHHSGVVAVPLVQNVLPRPQRGVQQLWGDVRGHHHEPVKHPGAQSTLNGGLVVGGQGVQLPQKHAHLPRTPCSEKRLNGSIRRGDHDPVQGRDLHPKKLPQNGNVVLQGFLLGEVQRHCIARGVLFLGDGCTALRKVPPAIILLRGLAGHRRDLCGSIELRLGLRIRQKAQAGKQLGGQPHRAVQLCGGGAVRARVRVQVDLALPILRELPCKSHVWGVPANQHVLAEYPVHKPHRHRGGDHDDLPAGYHEVVLARLPITLRGQQLHKVVFREALEPLKRRCQLGPQRRDHGLAEQDVLLQRCDHAAVGPVKRLQRGGQELIQPAGVPRVLPDLQLVQHMGPPQLSEEGPKRARLRDQQGEARPIGGRSRGGSRSAGAQCLKVRRVLGGDPLGNLLPPLLGLGGVQGYPEVPKGRGQSGREHVIVKLVQTAPGGLHHCKLQRAAVDPHRGVRALVQERGQEPMRQHKVGQRDGGAHPRSGEHLQVGCQAGHVARLLVRHCLLLNPRYLLCGDVRRHKKQPGLHPPSAVYDMRGLPPQRLRRKNLHRLRAKDVGHVHVGQPHSQEHRSGLEDLVGRDRLQPYAVHRGGLGDVSGDVVDLHRLPAKGLNGGKGGEPPQQPRVGTPRGHRTRAHRLNGEARREKDKRRAAKK
eukprot:RCo053728